MKNDEKYVSGKLFSVFEINGKKLMIAIKAKKLLKQDTLCYYDINDFEKPGTDMSTWRMQILKDALYRYMSKT